MAPPTTDRSLVEVSREHLEGSLENGRFRYMHRRRIDRADRNGDPLDGIVNLFDVAIVLAVAFLLAALTSFGLADIFSDKDVTIVTNPGTPDMRVIMKQGDQVRYLDMADGKQATGVGELIGRFYRLEDGTTVYVPAEPATGVTPSPQPSAEP
ncbi:MAG: DUF2149 domain-containing protein [Actinobacteria bacterium]|nr:DUF2149 domain-containing protein [Actinomycetota bacterium]